MSEFVKDDKMKTRFDLIEPEFIEGIAEILTFGAMKYSPDNWQKADDVDRYKSALLRHIYAYLKGEEIDPESGKSHLYHAGCNLMFLDYFERNADRPPLSHPSDADRWFGGYPMSSK